MKILQVNKFFYQFGGSETYFFNLRKALIRSGHEIIDFSMQNEDNLPSKYSKYFVSKVNYNTIGTFVDKLKTIGRIVYSFEAKRKIKELIEDTKPDIVHLHNFYHQISPSILSVFKKYNIPVVMTAHDYKILCPNYRMFTNNKACERCKKFRYYNVVRHKCIKNSRLASIVVMVEMYLHRWCLKSYRKNIDMLIAPSEFMREKFISWGWNESRIVHLPNFVDTKEIEENITQSEKQDYALYFGRLSHEKGVDVLIRAMSLVKSDIKLKIAGNGPKREEYKRLVKRLKIEDKVEFLGYKSGESLYGIVAKSRFTVMPSIVYENNPLAVIESYALGKAVIGAKIGGIPELVVHKETGLIFRPQDNQNLATKMDYAWNNEVEMEKMGEKGMIHIKKELTVKKHLKRILAIYKHVSNNEKNKI